MLSQQLTSGSSFNPQGELGAQPDWFFGPGPQAGGNVLVARARGHRGTAGRER
jgi:hypothetical protein